MPSFSLSALLRRRVVPLLLVLITLAGAALRLHDYLQLRALWLDEAMLALNLMQRTLPQLTLPLDYNQGAPLLFLFLEKAVILLLGGKDYELRLVPLAASLLSFPLLWLAGRRFLNRGGLLLLFSLFAFSPSLVAYSSTVKQYSSDVMVTLLLLWLGQRAVDGYPGRRSLLVFGAAGFFCLWLSHITLLLLPGFLLALLVKSLPSGGPFSRAGRPVLVTAGLCAAGAGLAYLANLRQINSNPFLFSYWEGHFLPLTSPAAAAAWLLNITAYTFHNPLQLPLIPSAALLFAGSGFMARQRPLHLAALLSPLVLLFAAAALHLYPLGDRLSLFILPPVFILISHGAEHLFSPGFRLPHRAAAWLLPAFALGLAAWVLLPPLQSSLEAYSQPNSGQDIKPLLKILARDSRPGDRLYVSPEVQPSFDFYRSFYPLPGVEVDALEFHAGSALLQNPAAFAAQMDRYRGAARLWLLFASIQESRPGAPNAEDLLIARLEPAGSRLRRERGRIAALYLYDLSRWRP